MDIRLAIIEDDKIVRDSLFTFFSQKEGIHVVGAFDSFEQFLEYIEMKDTQPPSVVLLDIQLPGMSGIDGIPIMHKYLPNCNIIMLTTFEDSNKIFSALSAGAVAYLSKQSSLATILDCVKTVIAGGSFMTPGIARKVVDYFTNNARPNNNPLSSRQQEIVDGIVDGLSYKMVGDKLGISLDTVRTHIMQIYRELNIHSKGELIKWALKR